MGVQQGCPLGVAYSVGVVSGRLVPGVHGRAGGPVPQRVGLVGEVAEPGQGLLELLHVGSAVQGAQIPVHRDGPGQHEHRPSGDLDGHRALGQLRAALGCGGDGQRRLAVAYRPREAQGDRFVVPDVGPGDHVRGQLGQLHSHRDQRSGRGLGLQRCLLGRLDPPAGQPASSGRRHRNGHRRAHGHPAPHRSARVPSQEPQPSCRGGPAVHRLSPCVRRDAARARLDCR